MTEHAVATDIAGLEWSAGAPKPVIFTSERRARIAFYGRDDRVGREVLTAEFVGCTSICMGFPNDEALHGHRLWGHGLSFYRVHEVRESSWLAELRAIESAHERSPAVPFETARHFLLTFHDSTVEAIARELVPGPTFLSMSEATTALAADMNA